MAGVIYITSMSRPDSALALAMLYALQNNGECRIGSVCVEGSGFGAARFCDIVYRFYRPPRNANEVLPTGFAVRQEPDPPMVKPALEGQYPHTIAKVSDTSEAASVIRNGVTLTAESVVILSAPATSLAKALDIQGAKGLFKERVKSLVIVDPQDSPAMRRVRNEFPAPIMTLNKEAGESLPFPAESIPTGEGNPVADVCRKFRQIPSHDMAAVLYAVRQEKGLFDPAQKDRIIQAYIELVNAKPRAHAVKQAIAPRA